MSPLVKKCFYIVKKQENLVCLFCVSISGQRKFAPPYEILNTPLVTGEHSGPKTVGRVMVMTVMGHHLRLKTHG